MSSRKLPGTNITRYRALKAAKERKDAVLPANVPLTAATAAKLDIFFPLYQAKMFAVNPALSGQTGTTSQVLTKKQQAIWYTSDFIDALQNAIRRGEFEESVRNLYNLPVNKPFRPEIRSEQDISDWGEYVHNGETNRIAAGGAPITFPSLALVDAAVNGFKTENQLQNDEKVAYDLALEALEADAVEADKLILKIWNEVEAAYDEGNAPSKRNKARKWGVVYVHAPGENPDPAEFSMMGTVTDQNGNPIDDAAVEVQETGDIELTDVHGHYFIPLLPPGNYTLNYHKAGHVDQVRTNVTAAPGTINEINVILFEVGTVSGTVTNTGIPANNAVVSINGTSLSSGTDANGEYSIGEVEPGDYVLSAFLNSNPANIKTLNINVMSGGTVTGNFSFP